MKITVTQPSLPPLEEFYESLKTIWESKWLTNGGPFHQEFESKLAEYLKVEHLSLFSNGTLALITALQALNLKGEVITTPYSFVATSHSLWWNGIKPVFVDIDPLTFNIDPDKIEAAITEDTTAIMPVHVYGKPCNIKAIQKIADRHKLKVIYDAAHAFGIEENEKSILKYGDLSILSFHATKVFNTIEGGAIISQSKEMKEKIDFLKNFGFADEVTVVAPGINAKMNEIQAAYGLLQLKYVDAEISKRKKVYETYLVNLKNIPGIKISEEAINTTQNYSYFPISIMENFPVSRDKAYEALKQEDVLSRRYFYPLISEFPPYNELESSNKENLPVALNISANIICLPIYAELELDKVIQICQILKNIQ